MVIRRAWASILFSTNSATALSGLFCDKAMMVMAFQSSPIRSRPELRGLRVLLFVLDMGSSAQAPSNENP
jgi:hypothetical protein